MKLMDRIALKQLLQMIIDLIVYIVDRLAPPRSKNKK